MPVPSLRIKMDLSNNYQNQVRAYKAFTQTQKLSNLKASQPSGKVGLAGPIVGRIFQVKPGCGSCGK